MRDYLLRSMLYVPAYRKKFIDSALNCNADALLIDLEDAVPAEFKADARVILKEYIETGAFKDRMVFVRLNPIDFKEFSRPPQHYWLDSLNTILKTKYLE